MSQASSEESVHGYLSVNSVLMCILDLSPALGAEAEYLIPVRFHFESVVFQNSLLALIHLRTLEFYNFPTARADEVVMVTVFVVVFIAYNPVIESNLSCQSAIADQLHCPMHRSITDTIIAIMQEPVEVIYGYMIFHIEKRIKNLHPLLSLTQSLGPDVSLKPLSLFRDHPHHRKLKTVFN